MSSSPPREAPTPGGDSGVDAVRLQRPLPTAQTLQVTRYIALGTFDGRL